MLQHKGVFRLRRRREEVTQKSEAGMLTDESRHAQYYRAASEYLEVAERKRDWKLSLDIPWDRIDRSRNSEHKAVCIETYCAEEMYLPDYSTNGFRMTRDLFGIAWFQARWSFEESRHALAFREYLVQSRLRSEAQLMALEAAVFSRAWTPPFDTVRRMVCYGALQEGVTYLAYRRQKSKAERDGDGALIAIFDNIAADEAAHAGFYRKIIEIELGYDRVGTLSDLGYVLANFKMPGDGLIERYHERLRFGDGGITAREFIERVVLSMLRNLKVTRAELRSAGEHRETDSPIKLQAQTVLSVLRVL
jgi:acyl-[acyl-carrier-protein] desaturase